MASILFFIVLETIVLGFCWIMSKRPIKPMKPLDTTEGVIEYSDGTINYAKGELKPFTSKANRGARDRREISRLSGWLRLHLGLYW